jgi:phosphopantothenoylcysteine synthetase/decarboxylase
VNKPSGTRLTVITCGAGPASDVATLVRLAQHRAWTVDIVATPSAVQFVNVVDLQQLTGSAVRSEYPAPGATRARTAQRSNALVVAPATYNTICKLAAGISDTYALGVLAEAIGLGTPVVILPFINAALAARAPFRRAVDDLRAEGVHILLGQPGWIPHPPGTGGQHATSFPWATALDAADAATGRSA